MAKKQQKSDDEAKKRIIKKLAILEKYKLMDDVLTKESEKMEEEMKRLHDQDKADAIKQKLKTK